MNDESSMNTTFVLSISRQNLDCSEVAEYMRKMKIPCSVTPNITVQKCTTNKDCEIEQGCSVIFNDEPVSEVWKNLKSEFDLTCAHLRGHSNYEGCIYDYVRPTNCPGSLGSSGNE